MENRVRYELIYTGRVQGVGFRYWAHMQATKYHLTGWARNEYDGSVTVQVQGYRFNVEAFEYAMQDGNRYIRIDHVDKRKIPYDPNESRFGVKY